MVRGVFVRNAPFVQVVLGWGHSVQNPVVILDTGFTGDLQVTPALARQLGLRVQGVTKTTIADGRTIDVPVALAVAAMEGATSIVQVMIADSLPLAGISFLTKFGYTAIVDCKHKTVELHR